MISRSNRFCLDTSLESQMLGLVAIRSSDAARFDANFKHGEKLVNLASSGQLRKFIDVIDNTADCDISFYFVVKMLHGALINGHLMLATYLLNHGYPLSNPLIPNALTGSLLVVSDDTAVSIVEFLVLTHGMDINCQV
jgi:hypothetical protein